MTRAGGAALDIASGHAAPPRRSLLRVDVTLVFAIAFATRIGIVLHSRGGVLGVFGYDSGVYYTAADALLHARLPYQDFLLLHPPALMLALTPFAALGTVTSDHTGFIVANTAFEVLGAVDAVLVLLVARRAGLTRIAALGAGCFYALWIGAAGSEFSIRLEPLGNALMLGALLLLVRCTATSRGRWVVSGALLGAAAVTKIWWVVPLLVVVAAVGRRDRRSALLVSAGAAAATAGIAGPFFVAAPGAMWRMVVLDQLGRHSVRPSLALRLVDFGSRGLPAAGRGIALTLAAVVVAAVGAVVLASMWRIASLRVVLVIGLAQSVVLLAAPVYLGYYSDYLAPAAALAVGAALAAAGNAISRPIRLIGAVGVLVAAATAGFTLGGPPGPQVSAFPAWTLALGVRRVHCVTADSPVALIELNVLSRTLGAGCPNRVDVSGSTYDVDRPAGKYLTRPQNRRWQQDLYRYLLSGDATIVIRHGTGISAATRRDLDRLPVIVSSRGIAVHRTH